MEKIDEFTFRKRYPYVLYDVIIDVRYVWVTDEKPIDSGFGIDISYLLDNMDLLEMVYPDALAGIKRIEDRFRKTENFSYKNHMCEEI